jgi:hypothetical protein
MFAGVDQAAAQGTTAFTYQGQLRDGGTNANGVYTMIFKLYDAYTNGNQIGAPITNSPGLFNGLFSVNLDFGAGAFNGNARWLGITVTNGPTTQTLWPRVQVLPSPYALYAAVAATVTNGAIMNAQLGVNAVQTTNVLDGAITSAKIAAGAVTNANLAVNAVATTNIQNGAIGTAQIADGTIINSKLALNAVNSNNIAGGQVVKSINGLFDNVSLSLIGVLTAGANTALFTNGYALQVSALVPNIAVFTTNGTFTVPTNVTRIKVEVWGGGGGGGTASQQYNGGGGGAGGYAFNILSVTNTILNLTTNVLGITNGASYTVTVGTGGTNAAPGTFSSFGGLLSANGGGAGTNATVTVNGGGGIGGTTTNSLVPLTGSAGTAGGVGSGSGASAFGDIGGIGGPGLPLGASGAGANANGPGAGGGGGPGGAYNPGGKGGPGLVIVYY